MPWLLEVAAVLAVPFIVTVPVPVEETTAASKIAMPLLSIRVPPPRPVMSILPLAEVVTLVPVSVTRMP